MRPEVQSEVSGIWENISNDNISSCADIDGYWNDFYELFGFGFDNVDYDEDVEIDVKIPSVNE